MAYAKLWSEWIIQIKISENVFSPAFLLIGGIELVIGVGGLEGLDPVLPGLAWVTVPCIDLDYVWLPIR